MHPSIQQVVELLIRSLVDDATAVIVTTTEEVEHTTVKVVVAPDDIGKVIGKQGRMARSLRTILSAVSVKHHHRYVLDIQEISHRSI